MKIVINRCFGGFGLSHDAVMRYAAIKGFKLYPFVEARKADGSLDSQKYVPYIKGKTFLIYYSKELLTEDCNYVEGSYFCDDDIERDDIALVQVVEEMGKDADGQHATLKIVEVPDGVRWQVEEYDGLEHIAEKHKTWI